MKFLNALFSDLPLKVLSLVLAFVVWHVVRQGLDAEPVLDFRVLTSVGGEPNLQARLVSPSNGRVSVKVKGPRQQVAQLSAMSDRIVVAQVPDGTPGPTDWEAPVSLELQDLEFPALEDLEGLRAVSVSPTEVRLHVQRIEQKTIAVLEPIPEEGDVPEHVTVEVIKKPSEIELRGTKERLDELESVQPLIPHSQLAQLILGMTDRTEGEFPIRLVVPGLGKDFTLVGTDYLEATVRITARKQVYVWVPIHAVFRPGEPLIHFDPGPPEWWRPRDGDQPPHIRLPFVGVPARVDALDGATLQAIVITGDLSEEVLSAGYGTAEPDILWAGVPKQIRDAVDPVYDEFPSVAVTVEK